MYQTVKTGGTAFRSPRHSNTSGGEVVAAKETGDKVSSSGVDFRSSVGFASMRPESPPPVIAGGTTEMRRSAHSPPGVDWRDTRSRVLSQMTNAKIDQALRGKIIH